MHLGRVSPQAVVYGEVMAQVPGSKKFEGLMPESMWTEYESWAEDRDITNRQLLKALFRLFLSAPDWLKVLALYGKVDRIQIEEGFRQLLLEHGTAVSPSETEDRIARLVVERAAAREAATGESSGAAPAAKTRARRARAQRKSG